MSTTTTLTDLLAEVVVADPDRRLVIDTYGDEREVTRGQLWQRVVSLAAELGERGVSAGDCVGVLMPNWSDSLVWQFAADALGAHVIGINTRYGVGDVAHVLEKARPVVVAVAHDFARIDLGARLRQAWTESGVPTPSVAVVPGPGRPPVGEAELASYDLGRGAWSPAESPEDPETSAYDRDALPSTGDHLAVAFTTSGSTGRPKLAGHLSSAVARHARNVAAAAGLTTESVVLLTLPLSGVLAFNPALATLAAGGTLVLEPSFDARATLERMARHRVSLMAVADDIGGRLMRSWQEQPADLGALTTFMTADFYGDSHKVAAWLEKEFGTTVVGIFGSSEIFALAGFWRPSDPSPQRWDGGGRLVDPDLGVRAVDPGTGDVLGPDGTGELQFRGYNTVDAYLGDDGTVQRNAFTDDGWFQSGDLGTVPEPGAFTYLCRMGDSLRLKGFLVEPAEIEVRLAEHPSVAMAKVVGVPMAGETVAVGFVLPAPGAAPDAEELRTWCAASLAKFKVPARIHVLEEMPMTVGTNGMKVKAAALRELAAGLAEKEMA